MTIPSFEGYSRNVTISDFELMITRSEVYLCEMTSTLKLAKQFISPGDGIIILDCHLVHFSIVNAHSERTIFFFTNNTSAPYGEILGLMKPLSRRSFNCFFNSLSSAWDIHWGGIEIGWVSGRRSIQKSIFLSGGTPGRPFGNIYGNSQTTGTDSRDGVSRLE